MLFRSGRYLGPGQNSFLPVWGSASYSGSVVFLSSFLSRQKDPKTFLHTVLHPQQHTYYHVYLLMCMFSTVCSLRLLPGSLQMCYVWLRSDWHAAYCCGLPSAVAMCVFVCVCVSECVRACVYVCVVVGEGGGDYFHLYSFFS